MPLGINIRRKKLDEKPQPEKETTYIVTGLESDIIDKLNISGISRWHGKNVCYFQAKNDEDLKKATEEIGRYADLSKVKIDKAIKH